MYRQVDEDRDGDVCRSEWGIYTQNELATTSQVKGVFQAGLGTEGPIQIKNLDDPGMQSIVDSFTKWDEDGDGTITNEELAKVLAALNPKFTDITTGKLMDEIDTNGDGFIDIFEFVAWLSGENVKKKKMKKKALDEQNAKVSCAMHRSRWKEAKALGKQEQFETARHAALEKWCVRKKIKVECNTYNNGTALCKVCKNRHAWLCHSCGFVSFYDDCINGCAESCGWSCISGKCYKKCGCKKKVDFWQRTGNVHDLRTLCLDVKKLLEVPE